MKFSKTAVMLALVSAPAFAQNAPSTDPITQDAIDLLKTSGIIERQSRIGEELLILEREIRRIQQVQVLVDLIGVEATLSNFPEFTDIIQGTPLELNARIRKAELETRLNTIGSQGETSQNRTDAEGPVARQGIMSAPILSGDRLPDAVIAQPDTQPELSLEEILEDFRESLLLEMQPWQSQDLDRDALLEELRSSMDAEITERLRSQEDLLLEEPQSSQEGQRISLREIYGVGENKRAVLQIGEQRFQVSQNDIFMGNILVREISNTQVILTSNGEQLVLRLAE
jgi:hypothetical protein